MLVFASVDGALQAARAIQDGAAKFDWGPQPREKMRLRVGMDMGDVIFDESDVHGNSAIIAVRLEGQCPPGGICRSRAVRDQARALPGMHFRKRGLLDLKNIDHPVEALSAAF